MAIIPATQTLHQDALQRWLARQKRSTQLYRGAEEPLEEAVGMFRPGGGFGAGQMQLAEDQARREKAEALTSQVASGMSSGSLATATGLRIGRDLTTTKLGIEDTRTQFLNQALQTLSGLRGTEAQQVGATVDPTYSPYMSALINRSANISANIQPYGGLEAWSAQYGVTAAKRKREEGLTERKAARTTGGYVELQF